MRTLIRHPLAAELGRYAVVGGVVAGVYVGGTLLLADMLGLAIQLAIVIAYVTAVALHFTLQRLFVFRNREIFALSIGAQLRSYVVIGAIQYALTAAATGWLPGLLEVSDTAVYLGCVVVLSASTFIALRTRVFHAH